jgi:hypothetical protein
MPKRSLRKHLFRRLSNDLRAVGELGLAFLMTAGVASCGGETSTSAIGDSGTGAKDVVSKDARGGVEGSVVEGVIDGPAPPHEGGVIDGLGFSEGGVIDGPANPEGGVYDGIANPEAGAIDGPANPEGGVIDGPPPSNVDSGGVDGH